jgi:tyrosyl-tRNA synthetase
VSNVIDEFGWRGLVYEATEGLSEVLAERSVTCYIGFDPTASSLHVGSLLPMLALARMQRAGHRPIAIVGGGTGLIGDPSGKAQERQLQTREQVRENLLGIQRQLARFLDFDAPTNAAQIIDNAEWLASIDLMTFLRDVGKYFTVNYMLAKEAVKRRLEAEDGVSYTEFSYLLLQSYDYLVLHDRLGCTLQLGGSDQWGNITAGCDLIRKLRGTRAHGLVMPLVTSSTGVKFGKTEAGTIWLDPARTSPFRFYQFWLNTDDRDVLTYLKYFTHLTQAEVGALGEEILRAPEKREAQRVLARSVTAMVHDEAAVVRAERASRLLFGEEITSLSLEDVLDVFEDVPSSEWPVDAFAGEGVAIADVLVKSSLAPSKSEAMRLVKGGGVSVNNRRVANERERLTREMAIDGRVFVVRRGARQQHLVRLIG